MATVHHMVLLQFKAGTPEKRIGDLFAALGRLRETIPGIVHCSGGPYASPEGLNQGYSHGFLMTFTGRAERNQYLDHPAHEAVKREFLPLVEKVVAFDFEEA
jgi:hypothetical protein